MTTINMSLRDRKAITVERFLQLSPTERAEIKESRIIPPRLGDNSFGKIEVLYKLPRAECPCVYVDNLVSC